MYLLIDSGSKDENEILFCLVPVCRREEVNKKIEE
jgi:hypothetical protein